MLKSTYVPYSHTMQWQQHNYFADPKWDPFAEQYRDQLAALDRIVLGYTDRIEGNLIYQHNETQLGQAFPGYLAKRQFIAMCALAHQHVLEIGFNAGHSALIMLTANPRLKFTAVDIGLHPYCIPCFDYLKTQFSDRIEFIHSDSARAWPMIQGLGYQYDFVHIDGSHEPTDLAVDLVNAMTHTVKGTRILVDDVNVPYLKTVVDFYRIQGRLIPLGDGNFPGDTQALYINNCD